MQLPYPPTNMNYVTAEQKEFCNSNNTISNSHFYIILKWEWNYLMKYAGTISIFLSGVVAPAHSKCLSALFSVQLRRVLSLLGLHIWILSGSSARTSYHKQSGFCPTQMWGGDHSIICVVHALGWLDPANRSTALKEYLKYLLALFYN
jgi:hypothetical protein